MENLILVKTLAELAKLKEEIKDSDFITYDTETNGLEKESCIIGFSICADLDKLKTAYYVVLYSWQQDRLVPLETLQGAKDFISSLCGKSLIMHNAGFDCWMTENNFDIKLMPYVHTDTLMLGHLLDENRSNGLKELGAALFGVTASAEQVEMKESVTKNGGQLTKKNYEMYKADSDILGRYGAKDALLTMQVFVTLLPKLYEESLEDFFYKDETMPLLRGPTYDLNTSGLRVDPQKLSDLKGSLEAECFEAQAFIYKEVFEHVKDKYPGTGKTNTFNIGSSKQLSWLLFFQLKQEFHVLTKEGRELCKALGLKIPYTAAAKRDFINMVTAAKDEIWQDEKWNYKTKKRNRAKKVGEPWNYIACGKDTLKLYSQKYTWVARYLEYAKNLKLLNTYVLGIQDRLKYNVIRPNFLQHGTTSGRYSCKNPNFQNLPRDDKRIKSCIVSRPGKVFVGADYSQLEPRVFASLSGDERLLNCFKVGDDFYSVIGVEVFDKYGCSLKKDEKGSFADRYPDLRNMAKVVGLSSTYGTTAPKMAPTIGKSIKEAQEVIDSYFEKFPSVYNLMLESHEMAKKHGVVHNLYGRPRRIPKAMEIPELFGDVEHFEIKDYVYRNLLNLAINHRIQSTGASIMNRAAIKCKYYIDQLGWTEVHIVLQVHDELVLEGPEDLAEEMAAVLKDSMESAADLPGVSLLAKPVIGRNLAELK